MDVTCGKCRTEYEFDESLISEAGTTVKCTSCGHLFRIFRPGTPDSSRLSSWMLRQPDGSVYTFERLATLQRWIAEGKASREDSVSRTGERWKPLGDISELAPFFEAADAARLDDAEEDWPDDGPTIQRAPGTRPGELVAKKATMTGYGPPKAPPPARRQPGRSAEPVDPLAATSPSGRAATPIVGRQEPDLAGVPEPAAAEGWEQGELLGDGGAPSWTGRASSGPSAPVGDEPAWTEGRISRTSSLDLDREDLEQKRRPPVGVLVSVGLVVVVLLVFGGIWLLKPDLLQRLAGQIVTSSESGDTASQAYLRGREYFLLDTDEGFEQADRELHRGGENDGLTRAGLAEIYTVWAQYYLDEVADARLRAKTAGPTEAAALRARADVRQDDFAQKLGQARRFVDAALKNAPESAEAHRAAADYYRLAGEIDKARTHVAKALDAARSDPEALAETEYVAALVDLSTGAEPAEVVGRLRSIVDHNAKLIRCHYRLARLYAARGDREDALGSLGRVLELSPDHSRARELRSELRGTAPLIVAVASATIVAATGTADAGGPADAGPPPSADAAPAAVAVASTSDAGPPPSAAVPGVEELGSPEAVIARASKLQSAGSRQACTLFKQVDKLRPGHPEVQTGLGYCALDEGRTGAAVGYFRRALGSSGSYGPALIGMAEASRAQGSKRQALDYYQRYLRTNPGGGQAAMARRNAERIEEELAEAGEPAGVEPGGEEPEAGTPAPPPPAPAPGPAAGGPESPSVTRITEDRTPAAPRSDSLAVDSEPPLRPGEEVE